MSSLGLCESKYSYNKHDVNHAIEYLKGYTGMPMDEVLFLSSPWFSINHETLVEEIKLSPSNRSNDRYVVSMIIKERTRDAISKAIQSTLSSVVILPDFEESKDTQNIFFDLPVQSTRDNTFLVFSGQNTALKMKCLQM